MGTIQRSRVQFHRNNRTKKKTSKMQFVDQKPEKPTLGDRKILAGAKVTVADTRKSKRPFARTSPTFGGAESESALYEDVSDTDVEEVPTFTKKRVASIEEIASSGDLQSTLRAAMAASDSASTAKGSADVDSWGSPSASLILQAPVYEIGRAHV